MGLYFQDIVRGANFTQTFQALDPSYPVANILSSTNASPIVLTTAQPHSFITGQKINVSNHIGNGAGLTGVAANSGNFTLGTVGIFTLPLSVSTGVGIGYGGQASACLDCTGQTITALMRDLDNETGALIATFTLAWIPDPTTGVFQLTLTKAQTLALAEGKYSAAIKRVDGSGNEYILIENDTVEVRSTPVG